MGYNISWIAVKGKPPEQAVSEAGLEDTSAFAEYASKVFTGHPLPDGWHLIVSRSCDSRLLSSEVLASLSVNCQVIGCAVEEHVMFSSAELWQNGVREWLVEHAAEKGLRHLKLEGKPPLQYETHVAEAGRQQDQDAEVDWFFEVPLLLARQLCQFKHDETSDFLDYERFAVYTMGKRQKKWWHLWRST